METIQHGYLFVFTYTKHESRLRCVQRCILHENRPCKFCENFTASGKTIVLEVELSDTINSVKAKTPNDMILSFNPTTSPYLLANGQGLGRIFCHADLCRIGVCYFDDDVTSEYVPFFIITQLASTKML